MNIRHARIEDLETIMNIEEENFRPEEAATKAAMQKRISHISDTFLVTEMEGLLTGYLVGVVHQERYLKDDLFTEIHSNPKMGGWIAILSLSISQEFQGQGYGSLLLAALKDLAVQTKREGISLTCHEELIPYYVRNGFCDEGESLSSHGGSQWYNLTWENKEYSE